MKIDFSLPILALDGKPAKDEDGTELTLGLVTGLAMLASYKDETDLSGKDKVGRFHVAEKAYLANEQEISIDEAATIKKLITKAYGPLVVARVYEILGEKD